MYVYVLYNMSIVAVMHFKLEASLYGLNCDIWKIFFKQNNI